MNVTLLLSLGYGITPDTVTLCGLTNVINCSGIEHVFVLLPPFTCSKVCDPVLRKLSIQLCIMLACCHSNTINHAPGVKCAGQIHVQQFTTCSHLTSCT